MNHLEFDRLLAEGTLPPVLLFEGEEAWLKQQAETLSTTMDPVRI